MTNRPDPQLFSAGYGKRIKTRNLAKLQRELDAITKMKELKEKGFSFWKIADVLNTMKVPTKTRKGRWHENCAGHFVKKWMTLFQIRN